MVRIARLPSPCGSSMRASAASRRSTDGVRFMGRSCTRMWGKLQPGQLIGAMRSTPYSFVIAGLDPAIHQVAGHLRSFVGPSSPSFIMDHRVIGERSDAVLRTAMPGDDTGGLGE